MSERLNWSEALGAAFCEVLEHLPTTGHARTSISLVVHVPEAQLRAGAGAGLLDTGGELSIHEVRRLACSAGQLPVVLGGASQVLDLGASTRLFTRAQSVATLGHVVGLRRAGL